MASAVIRFGILTVSDRCSTGETQDKSGPLLEQAVRNHSAFSGIVAKRACVPDNVLDISEKLISWSSYESGCDVILTTGGTGFSSRDVTPEATSKVITKRCDALAMMGLIRSSSPFAFLSRAAAGIREKTLIINLPGSARGANECFETIAPLLSHAVHLIVDNTDAVAHVHNISNMHITAKNDMLAHPMYHSLMSIPFLNHTEMPSKLHSQLLTSSVTAVKSGTRPRQSTWPMVDLSQAQNIVLESASKVAASLQSFTPLSESLGRIGSNCISKVNVPPFRASVKDGYAVRVADGTSPRMVISSASAGDESKQVPLNEGECIRINTGAPLPPGADAVVQVEDTKVLEMNQESHEIKIAILKSPSLGQDIREIGCDMAKGSMVMRDGDKINSSLLGVLASIGISQVPCFTVSICVFSTGDELMEIGQDLENGKVYDSNRLTLISLLKENSFTATDGGIIKDRPDEIFTRLHEELKRHDVIITTGSVSMGDKDYLKQVLASDLKAHIHFGRIDLKPGKPTTFADLVTEEGKHKLIFCLPGNPVSAAVTCHLLVLPALRKITRHRSYFANKIKVQVSEDVKFDDTRKEFKRAIVTYNPSGLPIASVTGEQASSRLCSMLEANALITTDKNSSKVMKGSTVDALMISNMKYL